MKRPASTLFLVLLSSNLVQAALWMPRTFEERINVAGHVIVGKAKKFQVIQVKWKKAGKAIVNVVEPKPEKLGEDQFLEVEIEESEVFYPNTASAGKTIKYWYQGPATISSIQQETPNKPLIYLLRGLNFSQNDKAGVVYWPVHGSDFAYSLENKTAVVELLKKRMEDEQKGIFAYDLPNT